MTHPTTTATDMIITAIKVEGAHSHFLFWLVGMAPRPARQVTTGIFVITGKGKKGCEVQR